MAIVTSERIPSGTKLLSVSQQAWQPLSCPAPPPPANLIDALKMAGDSQARTAWTARLARFAYDTAVEGATRKRDGSSCACGFAPNTAQPPSGPTAYVRVTTPRADDVSFPIVHANTTRGEKALHGTAAFAQVGSLARVCDAAGTALSDGSMTNDDFRHYFATITSRAVSAEAAHGGAIFPGHDLLNHSSRANAEASANNLDADDGALVVKAIADIGENEEITISYSGNLTASKSFRLYGFVDGDDADADAVCIIGDDWKAVHAECVASGAPQAILDSVENAANQSAIIVPANLNGVAELAGPLADAMRKANVEASMATATSAYITFAVLRAAASRLVMESDSDDHDDKLDGAFELGARAVKRAEGKACLSLSETLSSMM